MNAWIEGELLLRVVLLIPPNNQKPNLTLQSATRRSFWDKKLRPTGRSLWDGGSSWIILYFLAKFLAHQHGGSGFKFPSIS